MDSPKPYRKPHRDPPGYSHRFGYSPIHSEDDRIAIWRSKKGVNVFTGIARDAHEELLIKLDDPSGPLDGPGHIMTTEEFFTECYHYDGAPSIAESLPIHDVSDLLQDFQHKPSDFSDRQDDLFDVKYPFGRRLPCVRSDDYVKVATLRVVEGDKGSVTVRERFWVQVVSVTATGMVTGIACATLKSSGPDGFKIQENDFLAFPLTRCLGVKKGMHWG